MMTRTGLFPDAERRVSDLQLREFFGYNMKRAFNAVRSDLQRTLQPFGLRMMTYSALSIVVENPGLRPSQLADSLSIERANLAAILDDLEQRKWIRRRRSASDGRVRTLEATGEGREVYEAARSAVRAHDARMVAELDPAQRHALRAALTEIERSAQEAAK